MPVVLNEPLSALQRFSEDLEYSHLLDLACETEDPALRIAYDARAHDFKLTPTQSIRGFSLYLFQVRCCVCNCEQWEHCGATGKAIQPALGRNL